MISFKVTVQNIFIKTFSRFQNQCNRIKIKRQPDIDSDHVFPVRLLHHVVDGIATNKCDVDVVPGDDL